MSLEMCRFSDLARSAALVRDTPISGHHYSSTARRSASSGAAASMTRNPAFRRPDAIILAEICDLSRDKLTRRANHFGFSEIMSSPRIKNISLSPPGKSKAHQLPSCPEKRGVGHRHERGTGSGGRGCAFDERRGCVRRSRVVLTPRRWRQASRKCPRGDGDKKARSPGRARYKP